MPAICVTSLSIFSLLAFAIWSYQIFLCLGLMNLGRIWVINMCFRPKRRFNVVQNFEEPIIFCSSCAGGQGRKEDNRRNGCHILKRGIL